MGKLIDITGKQFNFLKVIGLDEDRNIKEKERIERKEITAAPIYWLCQCECGNVISTCYQSLKNGYTKSCGCKMKELLRRPNTYDLTGEYGIGYLKITNEPFYFDLEDYDKIKENSWYNNKKGYAATDINNKMIRLHTLITGYKMCDHINRNKLDNRKKNLRETTPLKNSWNKNIHSNNTSGFMGVSYRKDKKLWCATLVYNHKKINLGASKNKEIAIKKRLQGELKYYGKDYAPQRYLFKEYGILEDE